eukprot:g6889.t1
MALSSGPAGGLAGDLLPYQNQCSLRDVESNVDPASYEHFIETLRQGSAGLLRVGAAARVLQREAHKTSTFAKAALGAATSILDDPDGTPGVLAKRETQRYAIAWWNRYFRDLAKYEPQRIRARRSMADAKAEKEDLDSKLMQLQSINKDEFRKRLSDQRADLKERESDFQSNTQTNLQMKLQMAEGAGNKMAAAKYRDMLDDYWVKREREQAEIKEDLTKQETFLKKLPGEIKSAQSKVKSVSKRYENAAKRLSQIKGHLDGIPPRRNATLVCSVVGETIEVRSEVPSDLPRLGLVRRTPPAAVHGGVDATVFAAGNHTARHTAPRATLRTALRPGMGRLEAVQRAQEWHSEQLQELQGDVRDLKQMLQALAHQAAPRRPWDPANTHTHTTNTVDGSGSAERLGSLGDLEADQSVKDEAPQRSLSLTADPTVRVKEGG